MKILSITNMYPSKNYPNYGVFVKNFNEQLEEQGISVKVIKIEKANFRFKKILNYFELNFFTFFYIILGDYDYIYVHYPAMT
ncbi:MAG: hypothetical protein ABF630_07505, partial [Liquorilactobacillus sp.]